MFLQQHRTSRTLLSWLLKQPRLSWGKIRTLARSWLTQTAQIYNYGTSSNSGMKAKPSLQVISRWMVRPHDWHHRDWPATIGRSHSGGVYILFYVILTQTIKKR